MKIRRRIHNDMWTFRILTPEEMTNLENCDENTVGATIAEDKIVYIRNDHVTDNIIRHELFHVYFNYLYMPYREDVSMDAIEETLAQWFEHQSEAVIKQGKRFTKALKKLQREAK